jgi:DNA repair protein RadC
MQDPRAGIRVATVDANYATGGRLLYPSLETEPQIVSEKDLFGEDTSPQKKADKGADKGTLVNVIPEIDLIRLDNSELVDLGNRKLNGSADSFSVFKKIFPANKIGVQEYFYVLYVNRANDVIAYYNVSKGGTTGTVVDIEMVCNAAVKLLAKGVVVAHNHPSGNLTPSAGDKAVTQNLKTALKTLEIVLIDHLILAPNNRYFSFADDGIL